MEQLFSANAIQSVRYGRLSLDPDQEAICTYLMGDGPQFLLGPITLEEHLWLAVPSRLVDYALNLHWCGIWGAVDSLDRRHNDRALADDQGRIVSYWHPADGLHPRFWVVTRNVGMRPRTRVFVQHDA